MWDRGSQVTGEKASPFSFSQLGTLPFPNFECLLWPPSSALYALIHSPKQQQREADSSSSRCLHRRGSHISWGWGSNTEARRDQEERSFHLFPSPKYPDGQKARGCCLKTDLVFLFLLEGLGLIFLGFFCFFLNTELQYRFKNFCECWGRGREVRTSTVFSLLAFWSALMFFKRELRKNPTEITTKALLC